MYISKLSQGIWQLLSWVGVKSACLLDCLSKAVMLKKGTIDHPQYGNNEVNPLWTLYKGNFCLRQTPSEVQKTSLILKFHPKRGPCIWEGHFSWTHTVLLIEILLYHAELKLISAYLSEDFTCCECGGPKACYQSCGSYICPHHDNTPQG